MGKLINYKKIVKLLLVCIVLITIAIFIWNTDFNLVLAELETIGFRFFYIVLLTFIAYLLGTWAWKVCLLDASAKISVLQLFGIRQIGETIGLYNPTSIIGGDMVKAELLGAYDIDTDIAVNSVATSRITAILSQIMLFIIAVGWIAFFSISDTTSTFLASTLYSIVVVLILVKILLFYWLSSSTIHPHRKSAETGLIPRLRYRVFKVLYDIRNFYRNHTRIFWWSYLLFSAHWIIGSMEFYLILQFLGYDIQLMHGLVLDMSVIIIKSAGAFIPGQLGIEELGNKMMLGLIGITGTGVWITVSILRRARQLLWIGLGFLCYLLLPKKYNSHVSA